MLRNWSTNETFHFQLAVSTSYYFFYVKNYTTFNKFVRANGNGASSPVHSGLRDQVRNPTETIRPPPFLPLHSWLCLMLVCELQEQLLVHRMSAGRHSTGQKQIQAASTASLRACVAHLTEINVFSHPLSLQIWFKNYNNNCSNCTLYWKNNDNWKYRDIRIHREIEYGWKRRAANRMSANQRLSKQDSVVEEEMKRKRRLHWAKSAHMQGFFGDCHRTSKGKTTLLFRRRSGRHELCHSARAGMANHRPLVRRLFTSIWRHSWYSLQKEANENISGRKLSRFIPAGGCRGGAAGLAAFSR